MGTHAIPPNLFFCGIIGSGMSPLAALLARRGHRVRGSDRALDSGQGGEAATALRRLGVEFFPQDGSGITPDTGALVVSSAVEPEVPDVAAAARLGLPILKRADLLGAVFARGPAVAVGGTSGKTTVTGMAGHILRQSGADPTVINGGIMLNSRPDDPLGSTWAGREDLCVIEADESDGTIELYTPRVAAVTTLTLDHKSLPELRALFGNFVRRASRCAVIGADSPEALALAGQAAHAVTYSLTDRKADWRAGSVHPHGDGVCFRCRNRTVRLAVPGRHNVANALCAAACCEALGVAPAEALAALESFRGIERRLQVVGRTPDGITILDDFAHNPEKIAASLATLREQPGQIIVFYQPHGFRPTAMLRAGIVEAFASRLAGGDLVLMPEIYYAGGTAERNLSSRDLVADLAARGVDARFAESRAAAADAIERAVRPPRCRVVVMGARDPSLGPFARYLYDTLGQCD